MRRLYHGLLDATGLVAGLLILGLMLGVVADVAVRSTTGRPILWMFEITQYALLYIPCLGMAWLAREHGHVAITSFVGLASDRVQRGIIVAGLLLCACVCAFIAWWGGVVTHRSIMRGTIAGMMLRIPEYLTLWIIPFGFGLAALEFLRLALFDPMRPEGDMPEH